MTQRSLFDLEGYQFQAVDFALRQPRCALWIDLGLGKTAITLTALEQLIAEQEIKRTLVIGPKRVVRKGWPDEKAEWHHLNKLKMVNATGDQETRMRGLRTEADIHLLNFNVLPWLLKLFYRIEKVEHKKEDGDITFVKKVTQLRKLPWDCIVIDEATNMQDPSGAWYNALRYLQRGVKRVIELTADPIPNGYMGLWSQMFLLDQGLRLEGNITTYRKKFFNYDFGAEKYEINETASGRIQNAVKDITFTLRETDHLLNLPPYPEPEFVEVDLTKDEKAKYREMQRKYVMELAGKEVTAVNAGVVWGKLLQLANGSVWVNEDEWLPFHDHKLRALENITPKLGGPTMLVYLYKPDLYRIQELLTKMKKRWRLLDGEEDEDAWNDDKLDFLVLHPKSGGHGLNLHYGSGKTILWFGMTPSADLYKQTNARIFGGRRRLKKKDGRILHIVANGTQDLVVVDKVKTKTLNSESMKEAMVRLMKEMRQ